MLSNQVQKKCYCPVKTRDGVLDSTCACVWQWGHRDTWFLPGGLAEQAFYIQLANAVLPGLSYVVNHLNLSARLFAPFVHSQVTPASPPFPTE